MTTSLRKMMTCSAPFSLLSSAASLLGAVESHEGRRAHRRNHYLTPAELLPDPRIDTPWQRLWESQNDRAFVTPMGVDVTTFHN
ncbi:uncharacterized protein C8Q71DRAFT_354566 [Rhodofomes roseus]|uniref:Secreted protein n=1 Tax=Rhodofomes roseus TaxID=34475 RepID=A0ABQ8KTA2_9APHY|nr:uncharacterized protein C8Q71DRAFT_354566 [Rhodofomes roseus]KAH9841937.1 hypothetical protein C8Q71DRAFT_354566 [Rhodofomes roseus]